MEEWLGGLVKTSLNAEARKPQRGAGSDWELMQESGMNRFYRRGAKVVEGRKDGGGWDFGGEKSKRGGAEDGEGDAEVGH